MPEGLATCCFDDFSGDIALPLMLASAWAEVLHGEVETEIVQASRVFQISAKAKERQLLRPQFNGPFTPGTACVSPAVDPQGSSMAANTPSASPPVPTPPTKPSTSVASEQLTNSEIAQHLSTITVVP